MSGTFIQLHDSELESVAADAGDEVRVHFSLAYVVKSEGIAGVDSSTLWRQAGSIVISEAEIEGPSPTSTCKVVSGAITYAGFKYVDMLPLPLASGSMTTLELRLEDGSELLIRGIGVRDEMLDIPKYIRHLED